jgi:hypothetical protein
LSNRDISKKAVKSLKSEIIEEKDKRDFQFYVTIRLVSIPGYVSSYRRRAVEQTNFCNPDQIHRRVLYLNSSHRKVWLDSPRLWLIWRDFETCRFDEGSEPARSFDVFQILRASWARVNL